MSRFSPRATLAAQSSPWPAISPLKMLSRRSPEAPGQDSPGNGRFYRQEMDDFTFKSAVRETSEGSRAGSGRKWTISPLKSSPGSLRGLPGRIWQEMANFTFKNGVWDASRELPARIWQEIANFTSKSGLWEASWELLAKVWQEIANFTSKSGLWKTSWEHFNRKSLFY